MHLLTLDEVDELAQPDRLVSGVMQERHLLRERLSVDAVFGVDGAGELGGGADPVVEQNRDAGAIRG